MISQLKKGMVREKQESQNKESGRELMFSLRQGLIRKIYAYI